MNSNSYIVPIEAVNDFLAQLKTILISQNYELDILPRKKYEDPTDPFTTENTILDLGYDKEDICNELIALTSKDYIESIKDDKGVDKPPFWVFGKDVKSKEVYIKVKIRDRKSNKVFCVSFHYPRYPFKTKPYA